MQANKKNVSSRDSPFGAKYMYVVVASYNSIIVCFSVWALLVAETKSYKYTQLEAPGQLPLGGSPCHKQNSFLWGHVGTQGKIHTK